MRRIHVACFVVLLVPYESLATSLTVARGPGPLEVTLAWSNGVAPYEVHRSDSPQALLDGANAIGATAATSWTDQPPDALILFYAVVGSNDRPYFSEYVEGSSNNKALEIRNPAAGTFDLGSCSIRTYANGSTISSTFALPSVPLSGGDVFVVCNSAAGPALLSACDLSTSSSALAFNGDDAVELTCGGQILDVIGQIGFDPGTGWGTAPTRTNDATLRRRCSALSGDTIGSDPFDPTIGWAGFAVDTYGDLGSPSCDP